MSIESFLFQNNVHNFDFRRIVINGIVHADWRISV